MLRKPAISTELLASRRPFSDGIYLVGPFASRVSFSSQQRRVISLVCDINEDIKKSGDRTGIRGKDVCIVGAGLAGLTCAVVVAALGGNAFVHDKNAKNFDTAPGEGELGFALSTVRGAEHRDAHPTMNFWPQEDIEPITRLPFLNWYEGRCVSVAEQVAKAYDALAAKRTFGNKLKGVVSGCHVTGLEQVKRDGDVRFPWSKWKVRCGPTAPKLAVDVFDLVILAVGFGQETQARGVVTPSYWDCEGDRVTVAQQEGRSHFKNFVVSGTGDGGLIETLRLVFKDLRAGSVDEEMLTLVNDDDFSDRVSRVEAAANRLQADHVLHGGDPLISEAHKDVVSDFLWTEYCKLIPRLAKGFKKTLGGRRSDIETVTLIGKRSSPLELAAAPYHRLLLTACIGLGWVRYLQLDGSARITGRASVQVTRNGKPVEIPSRRVRFTSAKRIQSAPSDPADANGAFTFNTTHVTEQYDLHDAFVIVRHGYKSPLCTILRPEEITRLRRQQALYADQDQLRSDHAKLLKEANKEARINDPYDDSFPHNNHALMRRYFEERFKVRAEIGLDKEEQPCIQLVRTELTPRPLPAPLPTSVWGIRVAREEFYDGGNLDDGGWRP